MMTDQFYTAAVRYAKTMCCPICFQLMKRPKLLPSCRHSVCAGCLSKLKPAPVYDDDPSVPPLGISVLEEGLDVVFCPKCSLRSIIERVNASTFCESNNLVEAMIDALEPTRVLDDTMQRVVRAALMGDDIARRPLLVDPLNYFMKWKKVEHLFKAPAGVVKMLTITIRRVVTVVAICMDGTILGIPVYSMKTEPPWEGRIYVPDYLPGGQGDLGVLSAAYDMVTDCFYLVLSAPHGDKGVFWARLADVIQRGHIIGTKLEPLIPPTKKEGDTFLPRIFLGIAFDERRRILYACHADCIDISVWQIENFRATSRAPTRRLAQLVGLIKGRYLRQVMKDPNYKASFCAVFTPPVEEEDSSREFVQIRPIQHLIAISNTWGNTVNLVVTNEMPRSKALGAPENFYDDKVATAVVVATNEVDVPEKHAEAVSRPRDLAFDLYGNLYLADDENKTVKVLRFERWADRFWQLELQWPLPKLDSYPLTMAVVLDPERKKPPIALAALFNHDIVHFE